MDLDSADQEMAVFLAAPSGVVVCTDHSAFAGRCSETSVGLQDEETSVAPLDDVVSVAFVGPLDIEVSSAVDVAVSDQVVLVLVVRVLDLEVPVED